MSSLPPIFASNLDLDEVCHVLADMLGEPNPTARPSRYSAAARSIVWFTASKPRTKARKDCRA